MEISIQFLDNQKLQAHFDGYTVLSDQPVTNKGDATAPSPFDYFLASTALCAGYFTRAYCAARNLPTDGIKITQNNVKDSENKYKHAFHITVQVPQTFSEKDREGILRAIETCSVKRAIQQVPEFHVKVEGI